MTLREKLGVRGIVLDEHISPKAAEALFDLNELLDHASHTVEELEAENEFLKQALANALGTRAVVMQNTYGPLRIVKERNISDELIVRVAHD